MKDRQVAYIAAFSGFLSLGLGLVTSHETTSQSAWLAMQESVNREYIEYVITQTMSPIKPVDPIWLKAKEDQIARIDRQIADQKTRLSGISRTELLIIVSLILCQLRLLEWPSLRAEVYNRVLRVLLLVFFWCGILLGTIGLLRLCLIFTEA